MKGEVQASESWIPQDLPGFRPWLRSPVWRAEVRSASRVTHLFHLIQEDQHVLDGCPAAFPTPPCFLNKQGVDVCEDKPKST